MNLHSELERYSFPTEEDDMDIAERLRLEQPLDTINFKAPQLLAHHFGLTHPRFILSFDKGMGKTITYLATIYKDEGGKVLILCSENAKLAQRREIVRHLERWKFKYTFVEGQKPKRKQLWESDHEVYICTYDTLAADMGKRAKSSGRICPAWVDAESTHMALDEWHKKLRNKSSNVFKMLREFQNRRMIFSSGSAGGKGVHSMWPVLHLCDKKKFSAYWPYVKKHSIITETHFGQELSGCKDINAWRKEVAPYVFHRLKDAKDYPPKSRQALDVKMEPWQKKAHDSIRDQLIAFLPDDTFFAASTKIGALIKLRQFLVCPKVISPEYGYGAGLEGILADAQESELNHWVISTGFVQPMPYIRQFHLENKVPYHELKGGMNQYEVVEAIDSWTKKGGVMCQSIMFAESYELPAANHMYMLGFTHSPDQNAQAEDRIHRDKRVTPHPVDIWYVRHVNSIEKDIAEAMANTADNIHELMHKPLKELLNV